MSSFWRLTQMCLSPPSNRNNPSFHISVLALIPAFYYLRPCLYVTWNSLCYLLYLVVKGPWTRPTSWPLECRKSSSAKPEFKMIPTQPTQRSQLRAREGQLSCGSGSICSPPEVLRALNEWRVQGLTKVLESKLYWLNSSKIYPCCTKKK